MLYLTLPLVFPPESGRLLDSHWLPFLPGGTWPSLLFVHGGLGPSFAMHGAGHLSSFVGGAPGQSSFFVGGGAGRSSHGSWVVVVCPHLIVCGWCWCALISLFVGGVGVPSSVFMCCGAWNGHGQWQSILGGGSCFVWWQLLVIVGGAVVVMCEWSSAMAAVFVWWRLLVIIVGSVVIVCEWSWEVAVILGQWQLFLCVGGRWSSFSAVILVFGWFQCWHLLFGCHIAVGDMAPGFCVKEMIGRGEVSLLTWAHCCPCLYMGAGHHS